MLNHTLILNALCQDLSDLGVVRADVIVGLVRWFSVRSPEYVKRVTAWQLFLCAGTGDPLCGPLLVRAGAAQVWGDGYALSYNHQAIFVVHEIAMIFWKEEVPVEPDWDAYACRMAQSGRPDLSHPIIGKLAEHVRNVLGKAPSWDEMIGRSGTGATADRKDAETRWCFNHRPLGVPPTFYSFSPSDTTSFSTDVVLTARAACVPKNRKSPRIVASEPAAGMFAQLAVMNVLEQRLKCAYGYRVPIRNADIHREFLRRGHNLVTVDLSDASDYISMDLICNVLPPDWVDVLNSCRSQCVRLPDGRLVTLATYAPMGNGYCFRLLSLICAGILATTCKYSWSDFGDDMICHDRDWPGVQEGLLAAGLVINNNKTGKGRFIESCGIELLDGIEITPFKIKKLLQVGALFCDLPAALRAAHVGLRRLSTLLMQGWANRLTRYNRHYQRSEFRCPVWVTSSTQRHVEGYAGMLRWSTQRSDSVIDLVNHKIDVSQYQEFVKTRIHTRPGHRWLASLEEAWLEQQDHCDPFDDVECPDFSALLDLTELV